MFTDQLVRLRKQVGWTRSQLAQKLGYKTRKVSYWEIASPPKEIPQTDSNEISKLFRPFILDGIIKRMCGRTFKNIPSQLITVWLIEFNKKWGTTNDSFRDRNKYFISSSVIRLDYLDRPVKEKFLVEARFYPMNRIGLTSYPIQSAETIRLSGSRIKEFHAKHHKETQSSHHLPSGKVFSLLHIPVYITSIHSGVVPLFILSLQNRFDKKNTKKIVPYSDVDEKEAKKLIKEFKFELFEAMKLLDMLEPLEDFYFEELEFSKKGKKVKS